MNKSNVHFSQHILLTGFEPFGGAPLNPSEQVARALDGAAIGAARVYSLILPVDTQRAPEILREALRAASPAAVLCLGEAGGAAALTVGRVAINLLDFRIPDNAGVQLVDQPVIQGAPAAFFASLPVRKVCDLLKQAGIPAHLSLSAGSYLCNQVFYQLLYELNIQQRAIPAGFIHLPRLPEEAAAMDLQTPTMSLDTMLLGIRSVLEIMLE